MTKFKTIEQAANDNTRVISELFGNKNLYSIYIPEDKFSCYDGLVVDNETGNVAIVEVKVRAYSNNTLRKKYKGDVMLEKDKYECLHNSKKLFEKSGYTVSHILYVSVFDNIAYIFNIDNQKYDWFEKELVKSTYMNNDTRIKEIAYISIGDTMYFTQLSK